MACLALLGPVVLAGCDSTGPGGSLRDDLERNRGRWEAVAPAAYRYAVTRNCFCPAAAVGPVRLEVVGDSVASARYVDGGAPVDSALVSAFPTVVGLFEAIEDALDEEAYRVDVTWDPTSGVPLEIFIDYLENAVDEELGFMVTEPPAAFDLS